VNTQQLVKQLDTYLAKQKRAADVAAKAREADLQRQHAQTAEASRREIARLQKALVRMAAQRDAARGKAREYRAYAQKYQTELVAARRALRNHEH